MADLDVMRMATGDKLTEAIRRALPLLPAESRTVFSAMLRPESIAMVAGTLVAWAGSHAFGVGEIADIVLLGVGFLALGFSIFEGASEFFHFVGGAANAQSGTALDVAARHFAQAVTILGVSTVQALLLHGSMRAVIARNTPKLQARIRLADPPADGNRLSLKRPAMLVGGALGETDAYGVIEVSRNQSLSEQRITLMHELVHRYFSPRTGPWAQTTSRDQALAVWKLSAFALPRGSACGGIWPATCAWADAGIARVSIPCTRRLCDDFSAGERR